MAGAIFREMLKRDRPRVFASFVDEISEPEQKKLIERPLKRKAPGLHLRETGHGFAYLPRGSSARRLNGSAPWIPSGERGFVLHVARALIEIRLARHEHIDREFAGTDGPHQR